MKPLKLSIEIPVGDFTAGDIAGKAIRIARLNWRALFQMLFVPVLLASSAVDLAFWAIEKDNISVPVMLGCVASGVLINFFATWEIAMRKLALLESFAANKSDLNECLESSRTKSNRMLVIILPIVLMEFAMDIAMVFSMNSMKNGHGNARESDTIIGIGISLFVLFLTFPYLILYIYNSIFIAIYSYEKKSLMKTLSRFWELNKQDGVVVFVYAFLMMTLFMLSTTLGSVALVFMPLKDGILKDILMNIASLTFCTPMQTLLTSATTIGSAILYKQICARQDGSDLVERLSKLEAATQK